LFYFVLIIKKARSKKQNNHTYSMPGHYLLFRSRMLLFVPSGFEHSKVMQHPHRMYLSDFYGSHNKQQLFFYTSQID